MHAQQADYLRELVFNRQHARWDELRHAGGFASARALRLLRGSGPAIEAIMLIEHPLIDDETLLCEGAPMAAWRLNAFGLCEIAVHTFDPLAWPEAKWPFELVRFALDLGDKPAVTLNEHSATDRGLLVSCEAVRTPRGLKLMVKHKRRWRLKAAAAGAPRQLGVSTQSAMAFLRGEDRAMTA